MIHQVMLVIGFVSGSSLRTIFFIDFIILSDLFHLYGKSRKCFLLFGTSSRDELLSNCCWCCSCSLWFLLRLISQKTLLIVQNVYWFCSWKTFLMWFSSFCKCLFVKQVLYALLTNFRRFPFFFYLVHLMSN